MTYQLVDFVNFLWPSKKTWALIYAVIVFWPEPDFLFKSDSTYCVPQVAQQQTTSERTIIGELLVLEVSVTSIVELETKSTA